MAAHQIHTLESCRAVAALHATRKQLRRHAPRVYDAAAYHGWLDALYPLTPPPPESWTRDRVAEVAKLYETRAAMTRGPHQWAIKVARKNGWIDVLPPLTQTRGHPTKQNLQVKGITHPLAMVYSGLKARCTNPRSIAYDRYGGRGIKVCDRWLHGENGLTGFECFAQDMGSRPANHTIDRINNDGHYEPSNCRWASRAQQQQNTRRNKLTADQAAWIRASALGYKRLARLYGVNPSAIRAIKKNKAWIDAGELVL